jgi:hypothetical protein
MAECGYNYSRDLGQAPFADEAADCALPAVWHLLFPDGSTGLACASHRSVMAMSNGAPDDDHPLGVWCGQAGTLWARGSCVPSGERLFGAPGEPQ